MTKENVNTIKAKEIEQVRIAINTALNSGLGGDLFTVLLKRFMLVSENEWKFWEKLSDKEKESYGDLDVPLNYDKIGIDVIPDYVPMYILDGLKPIINGKIPERKSKLEEIIESKKK